MLTKRDQFSNLQLHVDDVDFIIQKHNQHVSNHIASAQSKATKPLLESQHIELGDLVYLVGDPISKGKQREQYIVASIDNKWCNLQKFTSNQLMTYRVKKSHCYNVPCYQYQPVTKTDNEPVQLCEDVESSFQSRRQSVSCETKSQPKEVPILLSSPDMPWHQPPLV